MTVKPSIGLNMKPKERSVSRNDALRRRYRGPDFLLLVIGILGSLHVFIMLGIEANRTYDSRREIRSLQADIRVLEREYNQLSSIILHADDLLYREALARQQGFMFPNEQRITIVSQQPAASSQE